MVNSSEFTLVYLSDQCQPNQVYHGLLSIRSPDGGYHHRQRLCQPSGLDECQSVWIDLSVMHKWPCVAIIAKQPYARWFDQRNRLLEPIPEALSQRFQPVRIAHADTRSALDLAQRT